MQKHSVAALVLVSYLCQGLASLIYQVSWEQAMENIVGSAIPTMTMIISIFLLGMGLGAYLSSKITFNYQSAIKFYFFSQFSLFVLGLLFVVSHNLRFLTYLSTGYIGWLPLVNLIRLSSVSLYLLLAAALIGTGFPILLSLSNLCQLNIGGRTLYLFNLLGSAIGAILTGFVLLPYFGMSKIITAAALAQLLAGAIIMVSMPVFKGLAQAKLPPNNNLLSQPGQQNLLVSANIANTGSSYSPQQSLIIISAFFNMFLELIFIRYYSLVIGSSIWAYSLVLVIVLLALSCGIWLVRITSRSKEILSILFFVAGSSLLLNSFFLSQLPFVFVDLKLHTGSLLSSIIIMLWTIFPSCLCLGTVLPHCFEFATQDFEFAPTKIDQMYATNLFSGVAGCLAGGTLAIPFLNLFSRHSIYLAFILSALILLLTGFYICSHYSNKRIFLLPAGLLFGFFLYVVFSLPWNEAVLTAGLPYFPPQDLAKRQLSKTIDLPILFYKEGINSTVSVTKNPQLNIACLKTDGQMEAALPLDANLPAPSSDKITQRLLGLLPLLLCPHQPKDIFLIGYGTGITANYILLNPYVEKLTIAEVEPAVIEAGNCLAKTCGLLVAAFNPKANTNILDGRSLLSLLDKRYDVIVSQPGEPSRNSSAHLYTLEFWQLAKRRLLPDGIFCQWLPLYAIDLRSLISLCRTFSYAFPNTYIVRPQGSAELILLGLNNAKNESPRLKTICPTFMTMSQWLNKLKQNQQNCLLNKDDYPFVQYELQSLLNAHGNNIDSDIEPILSNSFNSSQYSTLTK